MDTITILWIALSAPVFVASCYLIWIENGYISPLLILAIFAMTTILTFVFPLGMLFVVGMFVQWASDKNSILNTKLLVRK